MTIYINAFLSYSAKTKRDGWTDRQRDRRMDRRTGGRCYISRPGPSARREIISFSYVEHINIFGYLRSWGGGRASIIRLSPSWFISILSFILIYMSNIEAIS